MSYSYDRSASHRTASFLITKVVVDVDVNLSQPYELEVSEDGTVLRCSCSDPMQEQLICMTAKDRKRELVELIEDQKDRGGLRKKP